MNSELNICVIGAGIGGLTVATALARQGCKVTIYEQATEIGEVGAGLQVSPNGLRVLRALGLEEELAKQACRGKSVRLRRAESNLEVALLDLTLLPPEQSYYFVHRVDLIELLSNAARQVGVVVEMGCKLNAIELGKPAHVQFGNGTRASFDLVIDSGGLHSVLRPMLNPHASAFFTKHVAWRSIVPNETGRLNDVQVHMGPRQHIVSYPIRNGAFINLVAVEERDAWSAEGWSHQGDPALLRQIFSSAGSEISNMLARVEEVHLWGLFRHPVAQNWFGQGAVLLGDAAHPTLPFLAQGANMALEDAWALSFLLMQNQPLDQSLMEYQNLRKPRVEKVIEASNNNSWRYHLPPGPVRLAAHIALGVGSRIAPKVMLRQFDWLYAYDITSELSGK